MIVIPTLQSGNMTNQSITITRESSTRDDTRFFTEVHLLPGKLVLVVAIHPLDGLQANWQSKAKPSARAAHPLTIWGCSKPRAIHQSSQLRSPARKAQESLTNHLVRIETISNHELNTSAAPSHLGNQETPKSNKKSVANSRIKCH